MDEELAAEIREFRSPTDDETRMFYEIVIAPSYTPEGLAKLKGKSKTLRILEAKPRAPSGRSLRQVGGPLLEEAQSLTAVLGLSGFPLPTLETSICESDRRADKAIGSIDRRANQSDR